MQGVQRLVSQDNLHTKERDTQRKDLSREVLVRMIQLVLNSTMTQQMKIKMITAICRNQNRLKELLGYVEVL